MKKFLWVVIPIITLLASCVQNENLDSQSIAHSDYFSASIANSVRTELDGTAVVWNEDDQLTIFTKTSHNRLYKIKTLSNGNRTATFGYVSYTGTDDTAIAENYALYPYNADVTLVNGVVTSSLNAKQVYSGAEGNLRNALMVAKSSNNELTFENSTALVRFNVAKSIPDNYTLTAITLTSTANNIAGEVTINLANGDSKAVVTENGVKSVALTDINATITEEKQEFYVVLPAMSFAEGDLKVAFQFGENSREFALPAFELAQGGIKTIEYTIAESEDFSGTTPGTEAKPANNEIWYTATAKVTPYKTNVFGANILSNKWDSTTREGVIKFSGAITSIGKDAFYDCNSLTSITIPDSVTSIGDWAFYRCSSLASVTIGNSVTSIGYQTFEYCGNLTNIKIPNSVASIGDTAFAYCSRLKSVTIGNSVTSIGKSAFFSCGLTSVTIPDSVTKIGEYAFRSCGNLAAFYGKFASADNRCLIVEGVLNSFARAELTEYIIPEGVTSIGNYIFYSCSLTSITIPNSVTEIGEYTFANCSNLANVTIGNSVTSIGSYAFERCSSLASITIPDSVTSIGDFAFFYCTSLKEVYCKPTTPPSRGSDVFFSNASDMNIYVPVESVGAYKSTWAIYASCIEGYDF